MNPLLDLYQKLTFLLHSNINRTLLQMFNLPYTGNTIAITYNQISKQPVLQADWSFMKNHIFNHVLTLHKSTNRFTYFYRGMFYFCLSLSIFSLLLLKSFPSNAKEEHLQEGIAADIIRFHVIANSDSEKDQALKLEIKQVLTDELRPKLEQVKDIDKARTILKNNLEEMVLTANRIIKENGFDYTARASLEQGYFPLKVYGDLSLPPGQYEAVKVELGAAAGQNWWCVMFPPLCFVDATYSVVPDSSKADLKYLLTDEEYKAVFRKDTKVKVKFKLLSLIKDALKD